MHICIPTSYMHTHIHIHTYTQLHTWRERATGKSIQRQTGKYARTRCGTVSHERIHVGFHAGVSRLDLFSKTICRPWTKARALLQPSARKIALTRTAAGGAIRDPCAAAAVPSNAVRPPVVSVCFPLRPGHYDLLYLQLDETPPTSTQRLAAPEGR